MWESLSRIGQQVIQELKEEEEEGEGWGDWKLDGTTEVPHTQNSTSMELEEAKLQLDVQAQQTHELMQQLEQYKQLYQQLKDTLQQQDHTEADTSAVKVPILAWEQSQQHNKIISDIKALLDIQDDQGIFDTIKSNMNKATEYKKQVEQVNENFKLVHDELEDLRKAENNARNSGKKQEEQYNSLVEQMKKLQSDCRDAYKKEEESRKELERVALDLAKYRDSSLELEVELREARSTEDNLNRQLAIIRDDLANKQVVINNFTKLMDSKIADWLEEKNELEQEISNLNKELEILSEEAGVYQTKIAEYQNNSKDTSTKLSQRISDLEKQVKKLELELKDQDVLEKRNRELNESLQEKTIQCSSNLEALSNLQSVLEKMQSDHESEKKRLNKELEDARLISDQTEGSLKRLHILEDQLVQKDSLISEFKKELKSLRKYTVKVENDNDEIRKTLQATISRLDNFSEDENFVDRRLAIQLLVAYVEGKRAKKEVLELMSKILHFNEEDKVKVGLVPSKQPKASVFSSIVSIITPKGPELADSPKFNPNSVDSNSNLADLWIDFLMSETEDQMIKRKQEQRDVAEKAANLGVTDNSESEKEADEDLKTEPITK